MKNYNTRSLVEMQCPINIYRKNATHELLIFDPGLNDVVKVHANTKNQVSVFVFQWNAYNAKMYKQLRANIKHALLVNVKLAKCMQNRFQYH